MKSLTILLQIDANNDGVIDAHEFGMAMERGLIARYDILNLTFVLCSLNCLCCVLRAADQSIEAARVAATLAERTQQQPARKSRAPRSRSHTPPSRRSHTPPGSRSRRSSEALVDSMVARASRVASGSSNPFASPLASPRGERETTSKQNIRLSNVFDNGLTERVNKYTQDAATGYGNNREAPPEESRGRPRERLSPRKASIQDASLSDLRASHGEWVKKQKPNSSARERSPPPRQVDTGLMSAKRQMHDEVRVAKAKAASRRR